MQTMTPSEAQISVSRLIGATVLSLVTCTETKLNKGGRAGNPINPFFGRVRSVRVNNAQTNFHYDKAVETRLEKEINAERAENDEAPLEGDALRAEIDSRFNRGSSWHEMVTDEQGRLTPFCRHKTNGDLYYRVRLMGRGETTYIATSDIPNTPYSEGDEIPFESLEPYMPKRKPYANQGTKKAVEIITLKVESVVGIGMNGQRIKVVPTERNEHLPAKVREFVDNEINGLYRAEAAEAVA